jgi:hypothetical protein
MRTRIEESIVMGSWQQLKEELAPNRKADVDRTSDPTVREFAEVYSKDIARFTISDLTVRSRYSNLSLKFSGTYESNHYGAADAHHFIAERSKKVGPATVNRGIAVVKNMLTFALEREIIETHPLLRFRMLKEDKPADVS